MRLGPLRSFRLVKPPLPDERLDPFRDGVGVLSRGGEFAGHIATWVTPFWSPSSPLRMQWLVWYRVVWADGTRERWAEDYPPGWIAVDEMSQGYFEFSAYGSTSDVRYEFAWLDRDEAASFWKRLKIAAEDV